MHRSFTAALATVALVISLWLLSGTPPASALGAPAAAPALTRPSDPPWGG